MNVHEFANQFDNFKPSARAYYLADIIQYVAMKDDDHGRFVIDELLALLQDLEADDYFGTEGWRG